MIPGEPQMKLNHVKIDTIFSRSHDGCLIPMSIFSSSFIHKGTEVLSKCNSLKHQKYYDLCQIICV